MGKVPRKNYGSSIATCDIEVARESLLRIGYTVAATEVYGSSRSFTVSLGSMMMRVLFSLNQRNPKRSWVWATRLPGTWLPWRLSKEDADFLNAIEVLEYYTIGWVDDD